jgi:hypothetical protein
MNHCHGIAVPGPSASRSIVVEKKAAGNFPENITTNANDPRRCLLVLTANLTRLAQP